MPVRRLPSPRPSVHRFGGSRCEARRATPPRPMDSLRLDMHHAPRVAPCRRSVLRRLSLPRYRRAPPPILRWLSPCPCLLCLRCR
ncbi:hypothetical protein E2562_029440 [Oryza meyeriana var. granulata]|uniref:Uncharacterized protein n=1 Tax=Oryza meyeriana var. granulata TaxID=110450 RepID=A0A6G1E3W0_9ORYZ|nr:hypothetical protein E2562_029440 [Oryza meyeriana var. granulata]